MIAAVLLAVLAAPPTPIAIAVDLTEAPRRLYRSELTFPVTAGPLTLVYPKWIPGEHGPTGPLVDVAQLVFRADGKQLPWQRDPEDLHAFTLQVPAGATALKVELTLLSPPPNVGGFSAGSSATANLAVLSWNQVLLLPKGAAAASVQYKPQVTLPPGWKHACSLAANPGATKGGTVAFQPVSAQELVDSPLLAGAYLEITELGRLAGAPVSIAVAAETPGEGKLRPRDKAALERLVVEEAALYGARHFDRYLFLLTVSDDVPSFGLEHHQSSDNRLPGQVLVDGDLATAELVPLLAHESTHAWNGKFRRPEGLTRPDFQTPVRSELLWIYEGLTNYLGTVLSARAGAWDAATLREAIALTAERQRQQKGRSWRALEDTAISAQLLYGARGDWSTLRRGVDFYDEGTLIWLEVDATLREKSQGKKSLDDFVLAFHGGPSTGPQVKPYTLDEVVAALDAVVPFDWKGLLLARVQGFSTDAPLQGVEKAGWRLTYGPKEPTLLEIYEKEAKVIELRSAIGVSIDAESLAVIDVVPGSAADKAGLSPGVKLLAVNGRKLSPERLLTAVEQTRTGGPLALLGENAETFKTYTLTYKDGLRYPVLEAIAGKADLLEAIGRPRAKP